MRLIKTLLTSLVGLLIIPALALGAYTISQGGTGASTFNYGLLLSPGGLSPLINIATSSLGLLTTNVAEGTNLYFTNDRVNSFIAASTTIPKTYTLNTWTAGNVFSNASTTNLAVTSQTTGCAQFDVLGILTSTGTNCASATTPAGNSGDIQFNNSSAFGGSDNLFWNNALGRLGINKSSPSTALDVVGTASSTGLQVNGNGTITGKLTVPTASTTDLSASNRIYVNGSIFTNGGGSTKTTAISPTGDNTLGIGVGVTASNVEQIGTISGTSPLYTTVNFRPIGNSALDLGGTSNFWRHFYGTYASSTAISATTICISTDCKTAWPSGISGSGSAGQVTFWDGASSISGSANLFWNNNSQLLTISGGESLTGINGDNETDAPSVLTVSGGTGGFGVSSNSGAGGSISLTGGAGGDTDQSIIGGSGGGVSIYAGTGGTGSGGGTGGGISLSSGIGGPASDQQTGGNSGQVLLQVGQAADGGAGTGLDGGSGGSGGTISIVGSGGGNGGYTPADTQAGGAGGTGSFIGITSGGGGTGGDADGTGSVGGVGGNAGAITFATGNGGNGGNGSNSGAGGNAGDINLSPGTGGTGASAGSDGVVKVNSNLTVLNGKGITLGGVYKTAWPAGGGGSDTNWTFFNGSGIRPSTTTNQVVIGDSSATTTTSKLEVHGNASISGSLAFGSLASTLSVANGGTGSTTLSGILKGNGTGQVQTAIPGTDYQSVLTFPLTFSSGGTGNTSFNNKSIPFVGGGIFTEDPNLFVYDSTNHRLGIGTSTPGTTLSVAGPGVFNGQVTATSFTATSTSVASSFQQASTTMLSNSGNTYLATSLNGPLQAINGLVSATSTLSAAYGGTNVGVPSVGDLLLGGASGLWTRKAIGSNGQYLTSDGTTAQWITPGFASLTGPETFNGVITFTQYPVGPGTAPTTSAQLADKAYVDAARAGLSAKGAVQAATTTNVTSTSTLLVIDGYQTVSGDRVLLAGQTSSAKNGCYVAVTGNWARCTDYDEPSEMVQGSSFAVLNGTANQGVQFVQNSATVVTVDVSAITYVQNSARTIISCTAPISCSGNTIVGINLGTGGGLSTFGTTNLWADVDNSTISTTTGKIAVATGGIGATQLASGAVDLGGAKITGTAAILHGGTGATTANGALNNLLPSQAAQSGKVLTTDGANTSWTTVSSGGGGSGTLINYRAGLNQDNSEVNVFNTNADTALYTFSVPGNTMTLIHPLFPRVTGTYKNNSGATKTITAKLKYGAQTCASVTTATLASASASSTYVISGSLYNTTNTSIQGCSLSLNIMSGAGTQQAEVTAVGTTTIDSTVAQNLVVSVANSAAATLTGVTKNNALLEEGNATSTAAAAAAGSDTQIQLNTNGMLGASPVLALTSSTTPKMTLGGNLPLLQIGSTSPVYGYLVNDRVNVIDKRNDYSALNVYNESAGNCATADLTAANDLDSTALNFADLGHTSSGFNGSGCTNNPFTGFNANSTYLFDPSGYMSFALGTTTTGSFNWFTQGYAASNIKMTLTNGGKLGVGVTAPTTNLQVSATRPTLGLTDSSAATDHQNWLMTSQGGNLYVATSTNAGATTTRSALYVNGTTAGLGIGTSTPDGLVNNFVITMAVPKNTGIVTSKIFTDDGIASVDTNDPTGAGFQLDGLADVSSHSTAAGVTSLTWGTRKITAGLVNKWNYVDQSQVSHTGMSLANFAGNVRIGDSTADALSKLQVYGTRASTTISDSSAGTGLKNWGLSSQGGNFYIATSTDAGATSTVNALSISSNNAVSVSGLLGVGTNAPTDRLEVDQNTVGYAGMIVQNTNNNTNSGTYLQVGNDSSTFAGILRLSSTATTYAGANSLNLFASGSYNLGFVTAGDLKAIITPSGNLGIATSSPWRTLSVAGTFAANLTSSTNSDFVCFNPASKELTHTSGANCTGVASPFFSQYLGDKRVSDIEFLANLDSKAKANWQSFPLTDTTLKNYTIFIEDRKNEIEHIDALKVILYGSYDDKPSGTLQYVTLNAKVTDNRSVAARLWDGIMGKQFNPLASADGKELVMTKGDKFRIEFENPPKNFVTYSGVVRSYGYYVPTK